MSTLDRMLIESGAPGPSEGFVRDVMAAVRLDAEGPPPLVFPWRRLLVAVVVTVFGASWLLDASGAAEIGAMLLKEPALLWGMVLAVASGLATLVGLELA